MTDIHPGQEELLQAYRKLSNVSRSRKATARQRKLARDTMRRISTQYIGQLQEELVERTELLQKLTDELQQVVTQLKQGPISLAVRRLSDFVDQLPGRENPSHEN